MIKTVGFRQLVSSPFSRFIGEFETTDRVQLPTRAHSLIRYGLNPAIAEKLEDLADDVAEEARLVATFILVAYEGRELASRAELERWIERKGGIDEKKERKISNLFIEFAESDVWNSKDFSLGYALELLSVKGRAHEVNLAGHRTKRTGDFVPVVNRAQDGHQSFLCFSRA